MEIRRRNGKGNLVRDFWIRVDGGWKNVQIEYLLDLKKMPTDMKGRLRRWLGMMLCGIKNESLLLYAYKINPVLSSPQRSQHLDCPQNLHLSLEHSLSFSPKWNDGHNNASID